MKEKALDSRKYKLKEKTERALLQLGVIGRKMRESSLVTSSAQPRVTPSHHSQTEKGGKNHDGTVCLHHHLVFFFFFLVRRPCRRLFKFLFFFLCVRFYMCREKKRGRIGFATDLRKGQQKQQREKHMFDRRSDRK